MTIRIATRNLGRHGRRTALAVSAIALAQAVLVFYEGLLDGYVDWLTKTLTGPLIGHVQVHAPLWRDERSFDQSIFHADELLDTLSREPGIERAMPRIYAPVLVASGEEGHAAIVIGIDPALESSHGLIEGVGAASLGPRQVVIGRTLARLLDADPGQDLAVIGQAADGSIASALLNVSDVVTSSSDEVNRMGLLIPIDAARELFVLPDGASEIVLHATDPRKAEMLASRLSSAPALHGLEVLPWRLLMPELASLVEVVSAAGIIVMLIVFGAAASGVAHTLLASIFERLHEVGMLLALGTRPSVVIRTFVAEALLLGLLGSTIGSIAGLAVVGWTHHSGLDLGAFGGATRGELAFAGIQWTMRVFPRTEVVDVTRGIAAVMITAFVACLLPAWRASRLEPMEAMRR